MIDTHAHLDGSDDPDALVERAAAAGVGRIVAVGSGLASCRATLALAERHRGVFAALGVHPHQAATADAEPTALAELRRLLGHARVVAVGETGLDFFRDYAPRDRQRALFGAQLELAATHGKPVVVHTRAADDETRALLERVEGIVVLHCFSSPALLPLALERRWYVSFAGNVTYPRAAELRAAAAAVPKDRILAETDTPYLAPQPVRGRASEPAQVVHTLAVLAEARGEPAERLAEQIERNASAAFALPEDG